MTDKGTIRAVEVVETDWDEKIAIDSPYESRFYIQNLPWQEYAEEIDEYGSLKEKAESRGTNTKTSDLVEVFSAFEQYGFSDELACHQQWNPDALGGDGAWMVDADSWEELADFFEFAGFTVESDISL